jgi:hypothetical protein
MQSYMRSRIAIAAERSSDGVKMIQKMTAMNYLALGRVSSIGIAGNHQNFGAKNMVKI